MKTIHHTLLQLGFSDKEAEVYMTLNKLGHAPASTLARLTNIKRTSIYDILNALLQENYISSFEKDGLTYYAIDSLSKLVTREQEQLSLATSLVEELKKFQAGSTIDVQHYRGIAGLKEMYENILREKPKEMCVTLNLDYLYTVFNTDYDRGWTQERADNKIYARLLMMDTPIGRAFQKEDTNFFRQTVFLPKTHMFNTASFLYDGHICLFDFGDDLTGVHIQNRQLYEMQQASFEYTWEQFKPDGR